MPPSAASTNSRSPSDCEKAAGNTRRLFVWKSETPGTGPRVRLRALCSEGSEAFRDLLVHLLFAPCLSICGEGEDDTNANKEVAEYGEKLVDAGLALIADKEEEDPEGEETECYVKSFYGRFFCLYITISIYKCQA